MDVGALSVLEKVRERETKGRQGRQSFKVTVRRVQIGDVSVPHRVFSQAPAVLRRQ